MEDIADKKAKIAYEALEEKKAEDIKIISISKISPIADYFIIANGTNSLQVDAMVDEVRDKMAEAGFETKRVEGVNASGWVLMDYGDVVVHVFSREDRLFYDLERIWMDGKKINKEDL